MTKTPSLIAIDQSITNSLLSECRTWRADAVKFADGKFDKQHTELLAQDSGRFKP